MNFLLQKHLDNLKLNRFNMESVNYNIVNLGWQIKQILAVMCASVIGSTSQYCIVLYRDIEYRDDPVLQLLLCTENL